MTILTLLIAVLVFALLWYLLVILLPTSPQVKTIIKYALIILAVLWLLVTFFHGFNGIFNTKIN